MQPFQISISPKARKEFNDYVDYLIDHWPLKVSKRFVDKFDLLLSLLIEQPYSYPEVEAKKHIRRLLLDNHTWVYYRIKPRKRVVEILRIYHTKRQPL